MAQMHRRALPVSLLTLRPVMTRPNYKYNVQLLYAKTVFREAVKVRKKLKGRSAAVKVRFSYVRYNSIGPLRGP